VLLVLLLQKFEKHGQIYETEQNYRLGRFKLSLITCDKPVWN
jgi:hypothetical protein